MGIFSDFLNVFFPPRCVFCRKFLKSNESSICSSCTDSVPFTSGGETVRRGQYFDVCVSPLVYTGNVRKAFLRFKFKGATNYAEYFGKIMADCIKSHLSGRYDLITWVPLSKSRERQRGYDQSMLLAYAVALELEDVAVETLRKTTDVQAQSSLVGREKRQANVSGAYEVFDAELIVGKRILLIDDVVTTGATLSECSRMLLMAGAEEVMCAALATT
jgi:competence protein ComFC